MLKHTVTERNIKKANVSDSRGSNPQHQEESRGRVTEPEYQNTRIQSPSSEFYRDTRLTKSVRSVENVCGGDYSRYHRGSDWSSIRTTNVPTTRHVASREALNQTFGGHVSPPNGYLPYQQRLNQSEAINLQQFKPISNGPLHSKPVANGGLHISKEYVSPKESSHTESTVVRTSEVDNDIFSNGVKEILTSLGLLCLISLLLALLSLIFLLKISPVTATDVKDIMRAEQFTIISPDEYVTVYEVTLALCALSLSLNLCCLLVCSVQFLFAVKLARSSVNGDRTNKYLQKSAVTRVCAIAGFFISIPVFLTGVILYTFIQFHSTPAIVTSALIGSGIVFCGCAMVHNVFVWQKEKTNAVKALMRRQRLHQQLETSKLSVNSRTELKDTNAASFNTISPVLRCGPSIGLSSTATNPHELSTLV